jgi:hypothetical protein
MCQGSQTDPQCVGGDVGGAKTKTKKLK